MKNEKDVKNVKESEIRHSMVGVFAIVRGEDGEEKKVDMKKIVGSKGKNKG